MEQRSQNQFTGWLFIAAGLMLALGWAFLPVKIGEFFKVEDFAAIESHLNPWIWLFRFHLFGHLIAVMALVAFGTLLNEGLAKTVALPGIVVASSGLIVGAVAAAFYYHFGAWGALDMAGKQPEQLAEFVESIRIDTEYVTCLLRFSRVFFGLGQMVLGVGLVLAPKLLPRWISNSAIALGIVAMALTMTFPDDLHLYAPVFYLNSTWLFLCGIQMFRDNTTVE